MRKNNRRAVFHEPSLVPLADMLTNTVGIVVFILIFTVLVAGGIVVTKRLPVEHSTKAQPRHFVCAGGRVLPLNAESAVENILAKVGKPTSFYGINAWLDKLKAHKYEDEYFNVTGSGSIMDFVFIKQADIFFEFSPKEGKGETAAELASETSRFRQMLEGYDPEKDFIHFLVRPDSLDAFLAARNAATEKKGFGTGWVPIDEKEPIRFGNRGRQAMKQ